MLKRNPLKKNSPLTWIFPCGRKLLLNSPILIFLDLWVSFPVLQFSSCHISISTCCLFHWSVHKKNNFHCYFLSRKAFSVVFLTGLFTWERHFFQVFLQQRSFFHSACLSTAEISFQWKKHFGWNRRKNREKGIKV